MTLLVIYNKQWKMNNADLTQNLAMNRKLNIAFDITLKS